MKVATDVLHLPAFIQYLEILCYDDGYHIRKFATSPHRSQLSETTKWIASLNIVIDKYTLVDMWIDGHNLSDINEVIS